MRCLASVRALSALAARNARSADLDAITILCLRQHTGEQQITPLPGLIARHFASDSQPDPDEVRVPGYPKVNQIVEDILSLNLLEAADLTEILQKRLNIQPGSFAPALGQAQPAQVSSYLVPVPTSCRIWEDE